LCSYTSTNIEQSIRIFTKVNKVFLNLIQSRNLFHYISLLALDSTPPMDRHYNLIRNDKSKLKRMGHPIVKIVIAY